MATRDRSSVARPGRAWRSGLVLLTAASLLLAGAALAPVAAGQPKADGARWQTRTAELRARTTPRGAAKQAKEHPRPAHRALPRLTVTPRTGGRPPKAAPEPTLLPAGGEPAEGGVLAPAAPLLVSSPQFDGIANADQADIYEPPDPWIAAGPSHVVQVVNGLVRISGKTGAEIVTVPNWAFFSLGPDELDADPRIIYDDYHDRWLGVLLSRPDDGSFADNYLNLAVSETSDPTGAWSIFWLPYAEYLPDYPGIASSTDKIVLSANEFEYGTTFAGASVAVIPWSQVAAGTAVSYTWWGWGDVWTIRPAQVLSPSADVHLVASDYLSEQFAPHEILYAKVTGAASSPIEPSWASAGVGLDWDYAYSCEPQPRQPGSPATIAEAVDARITDAVWRNGALWFASTYPISDDGGTTCDLWARATALDVSGGAPATIVDVAFGSEGWDAFFPGVGISGDGTVFFVYSVSSPSAYVSTYARTWTPAYGWVAPQLIAAGEGTYSGSRWGDYVGVAADPSASAGAWQANEIPTADGSWRTVVSRLLFDLAPPAGPGVPNQTLLTNTTLGDTVPVKVYWSAASDPGSGIRRYELQAVTGGGSALLYPFSTGTATSVSQRHWWTPYGSSDRRYMQYQARAIDGYGNVGGWATGPTVFPYVYDQLTGTSYSGTWRSSSAGSYYNGSVRYSSTAGASVTFSFTGRSVGFLSYRSSSRGKVKVYVDGVYKGRVTLTSSSAMARRIVYATGWSTSASHKLKLVVSSGRVDIDGFVVLK
jgi:hypothetical protein